LTADFSWRDAGRTVVFRRGGLARAVEALRENGVEEFELLSTERALGEGGDGLAEAAQGGHLVASGQVPAAAGTRGAWRRPGG
jgi:hypothetical protein